MKEIIQNYQEQHKTPTLPLPQWLAKWGFALRQASDSARGIDLEAANHLSTASNIAFWNADSLNRLMLYEPKNCVEFLYEPYDQIPVITSVEESDIKKGRIDGELLNKLAKLTTRPNMDNIMKNKMLKEEDYTKYRDPAFYAVKSSIPGLIVAAANRIWIKLHIKIGERPPKEPYFPYLAIEGIQDADLFCPICGTTYVSYRIKKDGTIEYLKCYKKDDWQCDCGAQFNALLSYPNYRRIF